MSLVISAIKQSLYLCNNDIPRIRIEIDKAVDVLVPSADGFQTPPLIG